MFLEKYAPKSINEIIDKSAGNEIREWINKFENGRECERCVLLAGETGTGKTALINALANEYDYEILYVDEENINNFGIYTEMSGLFKKRLIVIDNAENINFKEILDFIQNSKNPIILTTTDPKNKKFDTISKFSLLITIKKPNYLQISKILEKICANEGIIIDKKFLDEISKNANGNIRSAIIDLENITVGRKKISEGDLILETRDRTIDIFKGLMGIFKSKNLLSAMAAYDEIDEEPKNIILWIDENIPEEYKDKNEIFNAYYLISRADIFLGRITNRQYWGFLRYVNEYLAGVCTAKNKTNFSFVKYKFPSFLLKMSKSKKEREMQQSIGRKIFPVLHVSPRFAKSYIVLFSLLLKNKKITEDELMTKYKFDEDEIEYIKEFKLNI